MKSKNEFVKDYILNMEAERVRLGLTQSEMAQRIEMSLSGYKKMISGRTASIDLYLAQKIYSITGKYVFEMIGLASPEFDIVRKLRKLSAEQLRFLNSIVDFEIKFTEQAKPAKEITVLVPSGACRDGMIWDSCKLEKVCIEDIEDPAEAPVVCGIKVTSDNLEPVYAAEDILLIAQRKPYTGETGIFVNRLDNRAYIRKYIDGAFAQLIPINGQGEIFPYNPNNEAEYNKWIVFGTVLSKIRRSHTERSAS